jgi:hypothetical protein
VPAGAVPRVLSWGVDLAVFGAVTRVTLQMWPLLGFLALAVWVIAGSLLLGSSPGQWMLRLKLRRPPDARVRFPRVLARFTLQHGWLAFSALALASLYQSSLATVSYLFAAIAAVGFLIGVVGSAAKLFTREGRTVVDLLSGTRVLVDVTGGN